MEINMILFQEKIKFNIKEIQDDLMSKPSIYEIILILKIYHKKQSILKT